MESWKLTDNGFYYCLNDENQLCLYNEDKNETWFLTIEQLKIIMSEWEEQNGGKY